MNINFIRKKENLLCADIVGEHILELYKSNYRGNRIFKAFDFNPKKNTLSEICPEIIKYDFISVQNCIYGIDSFYFASYAKGKENNLIFSLYEYDFSASECRKILEFEKDKSILNNLNRIQIFILNSSYVLIQSEIFTPEKAQDLMGYITFELTLYNTETKEATQVQAQDFKNNGINTILPVSKNRIMIKTGYSFIEDKRFSVLSEEEALIESVYLTSVTQLIADISLNSKTWTMDLLDAAYFDKCISTPQVKDEYIFYEIADMTNKTVDINFVNYNTLERFKYRKTDEGDADRIRPMVIADTPYIKIKFEKKENFFNLANGLPDMEFVDETFVCSLGNLLIFSKNRRGREKMRIYSYPHLDLLYEDQYSFSAGCYKDDDYYIYF